MKRQTLVFIALAITILYGVSFAAFDTSQAFVSLGAAVVAISWIAVGVFGREDTPNSRDSANERPRT